MTDWDLLQRWTSRTDDAAFAELVRRHLPFVHACARRQVGSHLAADVAQSVFLVLARKAPSFRSDVILSSWLFRTTGFVVAQIRRREARRTRLETEAAPMIASTPESDSTAAWSERVDPHLDDALAALSETDRGFVLTRYFEQRRFSDVAARFGVSEDAAKKRVARAVERMRAFLAGRGVAIPSATLGGLLLQPRTEAFPTTLSSTIERAVRNAGSSNPAGSVGELVEATLRQGFNTGLRRWILHSAAWVTAAALLLTTVSWLQPDSGPAPRAESVPSETPPVEASRSLVAGPSVPVPGSRRSLELTLLDAATGTPISGVEVDLRQHWGGPDARTLKTVTDGEGRCEWDLGDRPFEAVLATVAAPGYGHTELTWHGYEFTGERESYTCRLLRGTTLTGEVRDFRGRPVPNARVEITGDSGYPNGGRESSVFSVSLETDSEGHFRSFPIAPPRESFGHGGQGRQVSLQVAHPRFATAHLTLREAAALAEHQVITLGCGGTLKGRVMDPSGAPIIGARIADIGGRLVGRETHSGPLGEYELHHVGAVSHRINPLSWPLSASIEVVAHGYIPFSASLHVSGPTEAVVETFMQNPFQPELPRRVDVEMVESSDPNRFPLEYRVTVDVTLTPDDGQSDEFAEVVRPPAGPVRIAGTVTDAATGQPIPRFRIVSKGSAGDFGRLIGEGRHGAFDWTLPNAVGLRFAPSQAVHHPNPHSGDPTISPPSWIVLEAIADGYFPSGAYSELKPNGTDPIAFRLKNSAELSGWVELPSTRPAIGALIGMGGDGTVFIRDAHGHFRFQDDSRPATWSEAEGRFQITRSPSADRLQILHPEGCTLFPLGGAVGTETIIRLEPWSVVEGVVVSATGEPIPHVEVRLGPEPKPPLGRPAGFEFAYATRTDANGQFRFTHVPPGLAVASVNETGAPPPAETQVRLARGRPARIQLQLPASP